MTKIYTHNKPEFTVSEISNLIKRAIEENFGYVRVRGEISGLKYAPSGHIYFSLKDQDSVLSAACWKNISSSLKIKPEEGMEVIAIGQITSYAGQSKYQMIVSQLEHAGLGALMIMLEKRKKSLAAEGLFDESRKKTIPFLPDIIGVITSSTGAVIQDIIHRLRDRFPVKVLLWPVLVQGEKSADQITEALNGFNKMDLGNKPDVIIIARGGGSIEDLWSFNEEIVIRTAANSSIPIISAVGHETDTTLIDYVSDKRAPTATAAAEYAVPVRSELISLVNNLNYRITKSIYKYIDYKYDYLKSITRILPNYYRVIDNNIQRLDDLSMRFNVSCIRMCEIKQYKLTEMSIKLRDPTNIIHNKEQNIKLLSNKLNNIINSFIKDIEHKFILLSTMLNLNDIEKTLNKGFAIVRGKNNKIINSTRSIIDGDDISIEFKDGRSYYSILNKK